MNDPLRRTWPGALVELLALIHVWIGVEARGRDRLVRAHRRRRTRADTTAWAG